MSFNVENGNEVLWGGWNGEKGSRGRNGGRKRKKGKKKRETRTDRGGGHDDNFIFHFDGTMSVVSCAIAPCGGLLHRESIGCPKK